MNRLLFCLAACSLLLTGQVRAADKRPNILFCFADDWGRYASVYASLEKRPSPNQVVKTPNIDRVARSGVLFRNAFVNAPSCTPCRSALLSGRYFFNTGLGAILVGARWDPAIPSFPLLLRDAGYHIGKSYKVWSPGTPADAPFGQQKYAYQKAGNLPNNFSENVTRLVADGTKLAAARDRILAQVRGNFDAFLADRKPDQPWLYWFGPTTVHRTWIKGSGKALWGIDPETLKGKLPSFLPDVPEVREDFADYLGEVQAFDAYIGVLLERLKQTKQLDRTLIVISGDHGAPGFPRGKCNLYDFGVGVTLAAAWPGSKGGRVVDDFVNLMDLAPTFLEAGGVRLPEGMNGKSFLNVLKSEKSGQVDPSRSWVVTGRERHVGSAREGNVPYPQRALRTSDYLYIRNFAPERWPMGDPRGITATAAPSATQLETNTRVCYADMDASPTKAWLVAHRNDARWKRHHDLAFAKRPAEELYDLRKDPDQVNNVADKTAYAETKKQLANRLLNTLKQAGDPRVRGDGKHFEKPPFTSPEEPRRRAAARAEKTAPPNIVFILADDLGWTDLGCQGSKYYRTPHLDRMTKQGMRFTNGYTCGPNCQPTRAALLSGQYGPRTGVYTVGSIDRFDWQSRPLRPVDNVQNLPLDRVILAQALNKAGYATGMFGKWHLGQKGPYHPSERGFGEAIVSMGRHFDFNTSPKVDYPKGTYLADFLTDRAEAFIRKHRDQPFFLYLPHFGVHSPFQAKPELVKKFKDQPAAGGHHDPVYAAMIASVDESVGRVLKVLDDLKLSDNTLVIFSSDNGGVGGYVREGIKRGNDRTDNAPLRGGKGMLYEGGIRVPYLFRWTGKVAPGVVCDEPITSVDLYPTLLELAGVKPPTGQVLDGISYRKLLTGGGKGTLSREGLFWHFPGYLGAGKGHWRTTPAGAIRAGEWKLLEFFEDGRLELYRLTEDIGEKKNLSSSHPEKRDELHGKLLAWRKAIKAPMPTKRKP